LIGGNVKLVLEKAGVDGKKTLCLLVKMGCYDDHNTWGCWDHHNTSILPGKPRIFSRAKSLFSALA